jgi:hypothetical protein
VKSTLFEPIKYQTILEESANQFGVSLEDIKGRSREVRIVNARHVAMSLMRVFFECSYADIGRVFGRDHATVMNACKRVEYPRNKSLREVAILIAKKHMASISK